MRQPSGRVYWDGGPAPARGQVIMCRWPVGYWDGVDQDDSGVASAMVNTMQQVGGALGLAIFTSISTSAVGRYMSSHAGQRRDRLQTLAALSSYHTVFWVAAGVFVAGAVLIAAIFRDGSE